MSARTGKVSQYTKEQIAMARKLKSEGVLSMDEIADRAGMTKPSVQWHTRDIPKTRPSYFNQADEQVIIDMASEGYTLEYLADKFDCSVSKIHTVIGSNCSKADAICEELGIEKIPIGEMKRNFNADDLFEPIGITYRQKLTHVLVPVCYYQEIVEAAKQHA